MYNHNSFKVYSRKNPAITNFLDELNEDIFGNSSGLLDLKKIFTQAYDTLSYLSGEEMGVNFKSGKFDKIIKKSIENFIASHGFSDRDISIFKNRAGLDSEKFTLDQLAKTHAISNSRVAQIESKTYRSLRDEGQLRAFEKMIEYEFVRNITTSDMFENYRDFRFNNHVELSECVKHCPIEQLQLSGPLEHKLRGIGTVNDLINLTKREMDLRRISSKKVSAAINTALKIYGLSLKNI